MLLLAIASEVAGLALGFGEKHGERAIVTFSWSEFLPDAFIGLGMALFVVGMICTALGEGKLLRVYSVVAGLSLILIAMLKGSFLLAVVFGKGDAWISSIQGKLIFWLTLDSALVGALPWFMQWRKRRAERQQVLGSDQHASE